MLVDFKNSFNVRIRKKWLITWMKFFPPLLNFVATIPCKTNTSVNVRVKLWRFCVEKHQTSFLRICGLQTVQISIQLITRSVMSRSVVYTRGKSTSSTNWSRGWLKLGAGLNSRLSTWLLIRGAKDLIRACVRATGGHFNHSLWTYWLSWFCQLFVTFFVMFYLNFASLSKTPLL